MSLKLVETKDFERHYKKLKRAGGPADAVLRKVAASLLLWQRNDDPQLPRTHHGEDRVPHVIKYDLPGYYRLVVREHEGYRIPLMVGTHDEVDRWLETNRGRDFTVNRKSGRIEFTVVATTPEATEAVRGQAVPNPKATGPLLKHLPEDVLELLGFGEKLLRTLNRLATYERTDDADTWSDIDSLAFSSDEQREVTTQVLALILGGQVGPAIERIHHFRGNADTASASPDFFSKAIESGVNGDTLVNLSLLTSADFEHYLNNTDGLAGWMLFLHPDQRDLVHQEWSGPSRLLGVSGSGKTSVLVHRAKYLATKYETERILVLSLNRALCQLIEHLLDLLCPPAVRARIVVHTIYEYCYKLVKSIDPTRLIERQDAISGENLALCWRDFMRKAHALESVRPVIAALKKRRVDSHAYVFDE